MTSGALLHTVSPGEDLVGELDKLSAAAPAWLHGVGRVEGVEIVVARAGDDEALSLSGALSLVSLSGPGGGPYSVILSRGSGGAVEIFAGELRRARSRGVRVVSFPAQVATLDAPAGTPSSAGAAPSAGQQEDAPAPPTAWAAAAAASDRAAAAAAVEADVDEESDELPQYRDQVQHPVFGLCDVMVVKGERLKIRDVHGTGRMREIHLRVMKVLKPEMRGDKRVFRLVKRAE
jgi:hypothetical protein